MAKIRFDRMFGSLTECITELSAAYPDPVQTGTPVFKDGLVTFDNVAPVNFLFRGESDFFPSTQSPVIRLQRGGLSAATKQAILRVRDALREGLLDFIGTVNEPARPDPKLVDEYLQHYGMPMGFVDFTEAIRAASFFACHGSRAAIGVLPVTPGRLGLVTRNLGAHAFALRARVQRAYSVSADTPELDWKSKDARGRFEIRWFGCKVLSAERKRFGSMRYLLDTHTDPLGSMVTTLMHDFVQSNGPIDAEAADWVAQRIPALPLVGTEVVGAGGATPSHRPVTAAESGIVYIEPDLRQANREFWSGRLAYPTDAVRS